ncbi:MAG: 3'-5' exonuclease [Acidobacteriota bacterium]|nr:3'-5' exonuclease [Acidobacteriota bacterium]MDH3786510.1 3'-5' exonuclease [Acidobacteriota bacterium]
MSRLKLDRPLIYFDLETTGTNVMRDRIVEIAAKKVMPDGSDEIRSRRVNPECPIPAGASAVHGIYDADVADEPTFRQLAQGLFEFFLGCDLGGFNIVRFDVPILEREFRDCGFDLAVSERRQIDAMRIFHRQEPRDLTAAVRFYLDDDHAGAHAAEADVVATHRVVEAQLEKYADLPGDVASLDTWIRGGRADAVDRSGKFVWKEGEAAFGFGKHQGKSLRDVAASASGYLDWILQSDFPEDAKEIVRGARTGKFPTQSR